ncbi:MAG TPA: ABC transporter substrate-binding protein [Roseiarcus sp.]|jgi:ABC-type amino acid transport substrate-binding protein
MTFASFFCRIGLIGFIGAGLCVPAALAQDAKSPAKGGLLAKIKKRGVLTVGIAPDPPFEDRTPDGKWVGFLPALETKFAESLGVKVEFVPTTFTTIVAGLQAGKYDLAGADLHMTDERKRAIDFSDPFYASGTSFFLRADKGKTYKDQESLNSPDVTIAVITGSSDDTVARAALPKANLLTLPNVGPGDLVLQVKTGKVTAVGLSSYFAPALIQRFGLVMRPDTAEGVGSLPEAWGVRKDTPDLTAAANKFLADAKADGAIAALEKQYLTPDAFIKAFSLGGAP